MAILAIAFTESNVITYNKVCIKCKVEKPISDFHKHTQMKHGFRSDCKVCRNLFISEKQIIINENLEITKKNKDKIIYYTVKRKRGGQIKYTTEELKEVRRQKAKEYKLKNPEKIIKYKDFTDERKIKIKQDSVKYREKLKQDTERTEQHNSVRREYVHRNKDRIQNLRNISEKKRRKTDKVFSLKCSIRSRLKIAFKDLGFVKSKKTMDLLGLDIDTFIKHIERQFKKDMSWNNRGINGWHLDHIIPLSFAKTKEELISLCHYTNIQPMWAVDNLSKGNKIPQVQTKLTI